MGLAELRGPAGAHIQSMIDRSGARRAGTPDDIAAAAAFLAGPESSFIAGTGILTTGAVICGTLLRRGVLAGQGDSRHAGPAAGS
jgi:NAD(P)-dependent dehydrogenase (short-subunit alcohol dehydrogenase family)